MIHKIILIVIIFATVELVIGYIQSYSIAACVDAFFNNNFFGSRKTYLVSHVRSKFAVLRNLTPILEINSFLACIHKLANSLTL